MAKSLLASVIKPQNKYYRSEPIREFQINRTLYEQIRQVNQNNLTSNAIGFMGNSVTYKELLQSVDILAVAFERIGIKEGDIVPICLIATPEVPEILLALNKIGAVSKWIDMRATDEQFVRYLTESNIFVCLDILVPRIEKIIKETNVKHIISVSLRKSVEKNPENNVEDEKRNHELAKVQLADLPKFIPYAVLKQIGEGEKLTHEVNFNPNRPSIIIQSSGSTGLAKSIVHTDYSINNSIHNFSYMDLPLYVNHTLLMVAPPWLSYGLINSLYLSLAFGMKAEICPKLDKDLVFDNLGKFEIAFAVPLHYRYFSENTCEFFQKDLEKVKYFTTAGDRIDANELAELEHLLGKPIYNAYGCNEVLGIVTMNPSHENHKGTVGIPFYNTLVAAFDLDSHQELPFNKQGELCIKTETAFKEYISKNQETAKVKQRHKDGTEWIHTGDLGFVDEEGFVHIEGRLKRVIIRQGFKIYPGTIDEVIQKHQAVKECITIGIYDKHNGQAPMTFIVLKNNYVNKANQVEKELKVKCMNELKDYEQPVYLYFMDAIPYTPNNKQDFVKLEKIGNELICKNDL